MSHLPDAQIRSRQDRPLSLDFKRTRSLTLTLTRVKSAQGGIETAGSLREVGTAEWETEVMGSDVPVLVEFWGDWCAPRHRLNPILEEIAEERNNHLKVLKLDTDANPELVVTHAVRAAPTLVLFSDGVEQWRVVGFRPKSRMDAEIEAALARITASL